MIYDIVMFFVDNGSRILKFVNTVIDSVADIVKGNVSGVVNKINDVLGQMVPIIIGFLASLVGLGGIGQKIRAIVETLQKPITKALDFVIKTGLKLAGPIIRGIKGISGKVKAKVAAGKAWVKGKVAAGVAKIRGGDDTPEGKQKRLELGLKAARSAVNALPGRRIAAALARPALAAIRLRHGMTTLELVPTGKHWSVRGVVNPTDEAETDKETQGAGDGPGTLTAARESAKKAVGSVRAAMKEEATRKALADNGALKGELEGDLRSAEASLTDALQQAQDAEADPELAGLAIEELHNVQQKAESIRDRIGTVTAPAAETKKIAPGDSPIWTGLRGYSGRTKTDGDRYYEWDFTHGDIEVYNSRGEHLGSMHAVSGEMIKPAVRGRTIDL
jgi:hypothetical protein